MQVGDCFNDDTPISAEPDEVTVEARDVSEVAGIPCSEPHDNEVYAVFDLDLSAFPGADEIREIALESCLNA